MGVSANAETLTKVRIGNHPDKTRVVFETDGPSAHRIVSSGPSEIVIRLDADAVPEAIAGNGKPLLWVRIEPRIDGTDVRLQLARSVDTKEMVLQGPDRIVFDLITGAPAVAAVVPAPTPAPAPIEPEPEVTAEPVFEPEPLVELAEAEVAIEPVQSADEAFEEPALDEPAAISPTPTPVEATDRAGTKPAASAPPARSRGPLAILSNPMVMGAAGVVVLLIVFWAARRRSRSSSDEADEADEADEREAGSDMTDPADETTGSIGAAFAQSEAPEAAEAGSDGSVFDVNEAEVASADDPNDDLPGIPGTPMASVPVAAAAPLDTSELGDEMAAIVKELERRMVHLETRLEEVVDAKERLERQVSAQTEELRVQRAAIARTQRVLRGISRPEDEASEPVPK